MAGKRPLTAVDEVSSCTHCPFSVVAPSDAQGHLEVACGHQDAAPTADAGRVVETAVRAAEPGMLRTVVHPPTWCPLRASPTLVRLAPGVDAVVGRE